MFPSYLNDLYRIKEGRVKNKECRSRDRALNDANLDRNNATESLEISRQKMKEAKELRIKQTTDKRKYFLVRFKVLCLSWRKSSYKNLKEETSKSWDKTRLLKKTSFLLILFKKLERSNLEASFAKLIFVLITRERNEVKFWVFYAPKREN